MKRNLTLFTLFLILRLNAQQLYLNTTSLNGPYNPGANSTTGAAFIFADDVRIPSALIGTHAQIDVNKLVVGIVRAGTTNTPPAEPCVLNIYSSSVEDTATLLKNVIKLPMTQRGFSNVVASTSASYTASSLTLGTGAATIFSEPIEAENAFVGYGTFFIGLSIVETNPESNGVLLASGAASRFNGFWEIYSDSTVKIDGPFTFSGTGGADVSNLYLQVFGTFSGTIPVTLTDFYAEPADKNAVKLHWSTETERQNVGFDIERSTDGVTFERIGFVKGHGDHDGKMDYDFLDGLPINGYNYYRLKQQDLNGKFEFSKIAFARIAAPFGVKISPNPLTNRGLATISTDAAGTLIADIFDLSGRQISTVFNGKVSEGTTTLSLENLPNGVYILKTTLNGTTSNEKFVVQN